MARVLIAGCGYVGTALAERLVGAGHEVFALRRSPAEWPAGIVPIRADLCDIDSLRRLPSRLDFVFYAASADGSDDRAYRSAYVDGVRYLLAALDGQPPRRFFFTSSTGVYAQSEGEWVDESSPAEPRHFTELRLAGDHEPAEMGVVIRWLAAELEVSPRAAEAGFDGRVRYGRTSNKRVRSTKLLASRVRFRYPTFREGYGELIREANREGSGTHG